MSRRNPSDAGTMFGMLVGIVLGLWIISGIARYLIGS